MPKLTLSMIVKNEEQNLPNCLNSVKDIADEIVIVDTGSFDSSKEIAKKFNAKIYDFEWVNDFSSARNFALSKSSGEWILYLDADEWLEEKSRNELLRIIQSDKKSAVKCTVNSFDDFNNSPVSMRYTRLFTNDPAVKFEGKVHEQIDRSLQILNYENIESNIIINHSGYNVPKEQLREKAIRNLAMLFEEYAETENPYYAYQIANSYVIIGEREIAEEYYKTALTNNSLEHEYKIIALTNLAGNELEKLNFVEAKNYIEQGVLLNPSDPNFYFTAAQVYAKLDDYKITLDYLKRSYYFNNPPASETEFKLLNASIDQYKIIYLGVDISLKLGSRDLFKEFCSLLDKENKTSGRVGEVIESEILEFLTNSSKLSPDKAGQINFYFNQRSIDTYLNILQSNSDLGAVIELLEPVLKRFETNSNYLMAIGNCYVGLEKYNKAEKFLINALNIDISNPAVYLFLTSLYLKTDKYSSILPLIKKAKDQFKNSQDLLQTFHLIEEKVKCCT